jgi:hypothetical protein
MLYLNTAQKTRESLSLSLMFVDTTKTAGWLCCMLGGLAALGN